MKTRLKIVVPTSCEYEVYIHQHVYPFRSIEVSSFLNNFAIPCQSSYSATRTTWKHFSFKKTDNSKLTLLLKTYSNWFYRVLRQLNRNDSFVKSSAISVGSKSTYQIGYFIKLLWQQEIPPLVYKWLINNCQRKRNSIYIC